MADDGGGVPPTDDPEGDVLVRALRDAAVRGDAEAALDVLPRFPAAPAAAAHASGVTALMLACALGHSSLATMMVQSLALYARQIVAVERKPAPEVLRDLLDVRDATGYSALHRAVLNDRPECVALLLRAGAPCSPRAADGETPLHLAAEHADAVRLLPPLLAASPDFFVDRRGRSPLHYAVRCGHADVLRSLIEYARAYFTRPLAKVDTMEDREEDRKEADTEEEDRKEDKEEEKRMETPKEDEAAKEEGEEEEEKDDAVWNGTDRGDGNGFDPVRGARLELALETLVNQRDLRGETCLYVAAQLGHREIAEYLLRECHALPDLATEAGRTPLHAAAAAGSLYICALLCGEGANVEARGGSAAQTPLMLAAARGHTEVVRFLVRTMHSRIDGRDADGHTAAQLAAQRSRTRVLEVLCPGDGKEGKEKGGDENEEEMKVTLSSQAPNPRHDL